MNARVCEYLGIFYASFDIVTELRIPPGTYGTTISYVFTPLHSNVSNWVRHPSTRIKYRIKEESL